MGSASCLKVPALLARRKHPTSRNVKVRIFPSNYVLLGFTRSSFSTQTGESMEAEET